MELICPACDARYRLPDGAIGPAGRRVSCSSCGHGWHAVPKPLADPADDKTRIPGGNWSGQMAEIRQMLDEVQGADTKAADSDAATPTPEPEAPQVVEAAPPPPATDEVDPLREQLARHGAAPAGQATRRRKGDDRRSLMRQHNRKIRRRKARDAAGSGAFMTGFLLLVIVAAGMIALYHLKAPIVERFPSTAAAMDSYVAAVDDLHSGVVNGYADLRGWLIEKVGDKA